MPRRKRWRGRRRTARRQEAHDAAGEFVREEMEHIREGKHGARSTKQAIAIGLSKAGGRRAAQPPAKDRQRPDAKLGQARV